MSLLREAGQKELDKFVEINLNRTHQVIVEQNNYGHTENFLKFQFDQNLKPGSLVTAKITGYNDNILTATIVG